MYKKSIKQNFSDLGEWDFYCNDLVVEYQQCIDEGLDVEKYKDVFDAVINLPRSEVKKKLSDVIFEAVSACEETTDYKYSEPSESEEIKTLRKEHKFNKTSFDEETLKNKIAGAWTGRICGCLLGKPVEGIRTEEFLPLLKNSGNYPLKRFLFNL